MVTKRISKPLASWLTENILLMSFRNKAKGRFRRFRRPKDWDEYKLLRNLLLRMKKAYISYKLRCEPKLMWSTLRQFEIAQSSLNLSDIQDTTI